MKRKTEEIYELTEEEVKRLGAEGGAEGARQFVERLAEHIDDVRLLGRLKAGLITLDDICRLYDVKKRTVHSWPLEAADTPTQRNLYRVEDVAEQLAREG